MPDIAEIKSSYGVDLDVIEVDPQLSVEYYLSLIKERYLKRAVSRLYSSIDKKNLVSLDIESLYKPILRLSDEYKEIMSGGEEVIKTIPEVSNELIEILNKIPTNEPISLVTSPWPTFSKSIGGLMPGEIAIIAGRPGTGKTWMLYKWALYLAEKKFVVLLINTEMSANATMLRLACLNTGVKVSAVRNRDITTSELDRLKQELDRMKNLDNFIITDVGFSPTLSTIVKYIKMYNPSIVFIDSAYLIRADSSHYMSRTENASEVSDAIKVLATSNKIPIVYVIQHNREAVKGTPNLATLSLTDSNAWNSSFVLSIDPPPMKNSLGAVEFKTWEVHMIKNREGELPKFYISKETYDEVPSPEYSIFDGAITLKL